MVSKFYKSRIGFSIDDEGFGGGGLDGSDVATGADSTSNVIATVLDKTQTLQIVGAEILAKNAGVRSPNVTAVSPTSKVSTGLSTSTVILLGVALVSLTLVVIIAMKD